MDDDDDLVDPLNEPGDDLENGDLADGLLAPPADNLDLEVVDEFDVSDFDEDFDDDFEEEIEGEYDLQDDQYGEDFEKEFGHITDPVKAAGRKSKDVADDDDVDPDLDDDDEDVAFDEEE